MATSYGQRGGEGPTRGRRAETIEASFCGVAYRKRVFFGQRWLALSQNERGESVVTAWESEERANQHLLHVSGDDWPVQLVAEGHVR
jgi:hypothetical protein